jgi:hypothetical protein
MELLNKIQQGLKAPKGQTNTFGGYKYRSCEDIMEAVKPLLGKGTLVVSDEIVMLGDRFYVKATAALTCGDETVSATAYAREPLTKKGMDEAQITGATSSYARKYALNGLFAIDDTKDADVTNKHGKEKAKVVAEKKGCITVAQQAELRKLYSNIKFTKESGAAFGEKLEKDYEAARFEDVKSERFNELQTYMMGLL